MTQRKQDLFPAHDKHSTVLLFTKNRQGLLRPLVGILAKSTNSFSSGTFMSFEALAILLATFLRKPLPAEHKERTR
jgi:hypothetical protein